MTCSLCDDFFRFAGECAEVTGAERLGAGAEGRVRPERDTDVISESDAGGAAAAWGAGGGGRGAGLGGVASGVASSVILAILKQGLSAFEL